MKVLKDRKISGGRKAAIQLNCMTSLLGALKYIMNKKGNFKTAKVCALVKDIVEVREQKFFFNIPILSWLCFFLI